jgi:hypothetical protein
VDTLANGVIQVSNDAPTAWPLTPGAVLAEEHRFTGEDGTDAELGEPRSLAVDGEGRVYVVDAKPAVIKVFSADGEFVRTIGREGEGPGEFRVGFIAVRGPHLVLHDPRIGRTSVFDTAGTFVRSWNTSCCYWSDIQVDRENRIYIPSMVTRQPDAPIRGTAWVRWSLEGTVLDTLWVPYREADKIWNVEVKRDGKTVGAMSTSIPFMPTLASALHPAGGFVYGWTEGYEVIRSVTGADTARRFGRAWTPDQISEARRTNEVERRIKGASEGWGEDNIRAAFKLSDVPSTLPAYHSVRVDPLGRVWVRRYAVSDTTRTDFDLFDASGAWLGPVVAPLNLNEWTLQAWTETGLVTVIEDADGRPTVVRFRLEPPGG